jgi:hypothetical protein
MTVSHSIRNYLRTIPGTGRWHPLVTEQSPHRAYIGLGTERRHEPIKQAVGSRIGAGLKIASATILNRIDWGALLIGKGSERVLRRIDQAV